MITEGYGLNESQLMVTRGFGVKRLVIIYTRRAIKAYLECYVSMKGVLQNGS